MTQNIRYSVDADGIALLQIDVAGPADERADARLPGRPRRVHRQGRGATPRSRAPWSARPSRASWRARTSRTWSARSTAAPALREASEFSFGLSKLFRRLETCGKPVAAAINGVALGGGLEVALACHYRVIEDGPKAGVGLPEVTIGLLPGAGGTQRVPRLIGIPEALRLITEGRQLAPADALKKGLVHEVAPAAEIVERARQWILKGGEGVQPWDKKGFRIPGGAGQTSPAAAQAFMAGTALTARATMRNYPAPLAILSCIYEGTQVPIDQGLRIESKYFGKLLAGAVARNLMRTMFVNKGLADKLARRPAGPPKSQVRRLGILGAGMMGAGVAYVSARAGMDVVLLDSTLGARREGQGLFPQPAREGREPRQAHAGGRGCDPRAHQADGELRRPRRCRPRDRGGVREPRDQGRRHCEDRGGDPEECGVREQHLDAADHRASRRRRSVRRSSSACTSSRRSTRCRWSRSSSARRPARTRWPARSTTSGSCARRRSS